MITEPKHQFALALPNSPVFVHADAARLQQLFTNVLRPLALVSTEKFPEGQGVSVSTPRVV
jgi:C4-dicarboxylate-specific signal transduction histidine kinase